MKKFFALLLFVVALGGFSLVGCSGSSAPAPSDTPAAGSTDESTGEAAGDEAAGGEEKPAETETAPAE